jgi:hypothetical protein
MTLHCLVLINVPDGKQNNLRPGFPSLLDVTLEQLGEGLSKGLFTSVDLVNVSHAILLLKPTYGLESLQNSENIRSRVVILRCQLNILTV